MDSSGDDGFEKAEDCVAVGAFVDGNERGVISE